LKRIVFDVDKQCRHLKNYKQKECVILSDKYQEISHCSGI
jgi:hypothetical protein